MDPQVYAVVKKVHTLLAGKKEATLTNTEISYITGLLESALTLCSDPNGTPIDGITMPEEKKPFYRRLLD